MILQPSGSFIPLIITRKLLLLLPNTKTPLAQHSKSLLFNIGYKFFNSRITLRAKSKQPKIQFLFEKRIDIFLYRLKAREIKQFTRRLYSYGTLRAKICFTKYLLNLPLAPFPPFLNV